MRPGYARASTDDQRLDHQRERLREAGCERLFEEKASGARRDRPEFARLLDQLRGDDVVVVTRLNRLARSIRDLAEVAEAIRAEEAGLLSLAEPWADTTSPAGRVVLTGVAEFERELIRQRTGEERQAARERGVSFGRPSKLRLDRREHTTRLLREGRSVGEVARTFDVHPATIYRCTETPAVRPRPKAS